MRPLFLLALSFFVVSQGTAPVSAQEPGDDSTEATIAESSDPDATVISSEPDVIERNPLEYNAELLDEIFQESTEATIREQKFAAAAGITGGMILVGLSAWRLIEAEPQNSYSRGLGVMFMTLGMVDLTTGIYAATRISHERKRLERWDRARKNGVTAVELAHFEGELQSSQETREGERLLVRWNGLTHAIAGALVLAFTPIPSGSSRTDKVSGYVVGGLFMATGFGAFAASFRPTPSERAWQSYNKRKRPMPGHEITWRAAPAISRRGAGLSFGGTF